MFHFKRFSMTALLALMVLSLALPIASIAKERKRDNRRDKHVVRNVKDSGYMPFFVIGGVIGVFVLGSSVFGQRSDGTIVKLGNVGDNKTLRKSLAEQSRNDR